MSRTFRISEYDDPTRRNRCSGIFYVWSLDVLCPAIPKSKYNSGVPEGFAPLVLLCGACWKDIIGMLPFKP